MEERGTNLIMCDEILNFLIHGILFVCSGIFRSEFGPCLAGELRGICGRQHPVLIHICWLSNTLKDINVPSFSSSILLIERQQMNQKRENIMKEIIY